VRRFLLVAAAGAALFALSEAAKAASMDNHGGTIGLSGPIEAGDAQRFATLAARGARTVSIGGSQGGDTGESMLIATMIRNAGMHTTVSGGCASACVTIFSGGVSRSITGSGRLYVHSAREFSSTAGAGAREGSASYETTMRLVRFLYGLGVPSSVLGKLVSTPPSGLALLGPVELNDWGVY
jgi:hypothetical protein